MRKSQAYYGLSGNGWWWSWADVFFRRRHHQSWSPFHYERAETIGIRIGRWEIGITKHTKHFADNNWKAE